MSCRREYVRPELLRTHHLITYLNDSEYRELAEKAASAGLKKPEFIRRSIAGVKICEIPRPEIRELLHLLKRVSGETENMYLALLRTERIPEAEEFRELSVSCREAARTVLDSFRPVNNG